MAKIIAFLVFASIILMGVFPLLGFVYSLFKPTKFSKKALLALPVPLVPLLLFRLNVLYPWPFPGHESAAVAAAFAFPALLALLMAVSGTSSLAEQFPSKPWLAILVVAGCPGLNFAICWLFLGHIDEYFLGLSVSSGGIVAMLALLFGIAAWSRRP
jgi:hypothetical protein